MEKQIEALRACADVLHAEPQDHAVVLLGAGGAVLRVYGVELERAQAEDWTEFFPDASVLTMAELQERRKR